MNNSISSFTVPPEFELRIETEPGGNPTTVILRSGTAEIFGAEVAIGQRVTLTGQKIAVFTWHGAQIDLEGQPAHAYVAGETPMLAYANTHAVLEERRRKAREAGPSVDGPRVMLVGPTDAGKSTLTRILANYAIRMGWSPALVDLDLGQQGITCPGNLAAVAIETPIEASGVIPLDLPLVFHYGNITVDNAELYKYQVERIGEMLAARAVATPGAAAAGFLVNTMGWIDGLGYELIRHAIAALRVDVVLVLGQDRLHSVLSQECAALPQRPSVVKLGKSGGVVLRSQEYRKLTRSKRFREYFYGPNNDLSPISLTAGFDFLEIFKVGTPLRAGASMLPVGVEASADPLKVSPVQPSVALENSVVAVSHATTPAEILTANVAGFIYITAVDMNERTITYLAPNASPMPGRYLVAGSIKWIDDN